MSDGVIQLRHAFLRWPLCVSVVATLCATLIDGRVISSSLHQSLELRGIELARSIDGGAMVTGNRGYLQNLVAGLSAYGTTATVLVARGEPAVIVAASNPKLIGTSLETLPDAVRQMLMSEAAEVARERRLDEVVANLRREFAVTVDEARLRRIPWPPAPAGLGSM